MAKIRRIRHRRDLSKAVAALAASDRQMAKIAKRAGTLSVNSAEGGFEALTSIVVSQQLSAAAADTIFARLKERIVPFEPAGLLAAGDDLLRGAGLSAPKQKHLRAIASRIASGELDLAGIDEMHDDEAHAHLIETKGIGPWTAEIYLMFSLQRADVWPAGDVALQAAVAQALSLRKRPDAKAMIKLGERFRPWRTVAARLFWAHYRAEQAAAKHKKAKNAKRKRSRAKRA